MAQYGFLIDLSRCIGCHACEISCKQWHDIPPGAVKWMRVYQWENGAFPLPDFKILPLPCLHCEIPVCAEACPNKAIYKEERYGAVLVDPEKCTGERKCWQACPYGAPQFADDASGSKMSKCTMCIDRLEEGLKPICVLSCSMRALEFGPIDELMKKYGNLKHIEDMPKKDFAPCRVACPAGVNAEAYITLIAENKFEEALDLFRQTTPFAGVLGRTCIRPCESNCQRGRFDDAIAICSLKRFIADKGLQQPRVKANPVIKATQSDKVAVVGSGPAGLQCAYDLVKMGYPVTVFEAEKKAGGLLRYGIPAYRLPKKVLDNEINYIKKSGVSIQLNSPVKNLDDIFAQGCKAVFVATGAWLSLKLGVEGEDVEGILYSLEFLRRVNTGGKVKLGSKVVVVGGGSVAVDSARTAMRLGANEVHLICLECRNVTSKDRMLAQDREIEEAEEEGIVIYPCLGVGKFITEGGKIEGIETIACVSVRDEDGTFNPKFNDNSTSLVNADTVIIAIGQSADRGLFSEEMKRSSVKTLVVDPLTLQTDNERIFAGGDLVSGPLDIISAIASGKEAAVSIDRYLKGEDLKRGRYLPARSVREGVKVKTVQSSTFDIKKRRSFNEVEMGFSSNIAVEQANRCLHCGTTVPSVVFIREMPKKQIVPWDYKKVLELWQKRNPATGERLPDVFKRYSDVLQSAENFGGRNKLTLKAKSVEELLFYTTDDE